MMPWTSDELHAVGTAEELDLAVARADGTLRRPVTIWVVRHEQDLYIRSWRGRTSGWYRGVQQHGEGHVHAGGVEKDVLLVAAGDAVNDAVDAAYQAKYQRYLDTYVPPMLSSQARETTLRLVPREAHGEE